MANYISGLKQFTEQEGEEFKELVELSESTNTDGDGGVAKSSTGLICGMKGYK